MYEALKILSFFVSLLPCSAVDLHPRAATKVAEQKQYKAIAITSKQQEMEKKV